MGGDGMGAYGKTVSGARAYSRTYQDFNGVNLLSDIGNIPTNEFAYVENMYRDYMAGDAASVESVPGFRCLASLSGNPNGMYSIPEDDRTLILLHIGEKLYRFYLDERESIQDLSPFYTGLSDRKSVGFYFGGAFYLLDGEGYYRIDGDCVKSVTAEAYLPTTYLNGKAYEQRNLLRKTTVERYIPADLTEYESAADLLIYTLNPDGNSCYVSGVRDKSVTAITVRAHAVVLGRELPVTGIGECAFEGCNAERIRLPEGVTVIERSAFRNCRRLTSLVLPNTVERIEALAFFGCSALADIYIGGRVSFIGGAAFGYTSITTVRYALGLEGLEEIEEEVVDVEPSCLSELAGSPDVMFYIAAEKPTESGGSYRFPVSGEAKGLLSLTVDGGTIGNASTPVFSVNSENQFSSDKVYAALIAHPSVAMMSLTVSRDGSFTVHGFSDFDDTVEIVTLTGLSGYYRLIGVPEGFTGASLRVVRNTGETAVSYTDTGNGVTVGPMLPSESLTLYLDVARSVDFPHVLFVPRLLAAVGNASMCPVYENKNGKACVTAVDISVSDDRCLSMRQVDMRLSMHDAGEEAFIGNTGYAGDSVLAVTGCRCAAVYDGRIFFSGNPRLPHTVLYTARRKDGVVDAGYIGAESYFCDGSGKAPVSALVASSGGLYVFKGDADDGAFAYRHTGSDTGDGLLARVYPIAETVAGVMRVSSARNFAGLPVFLSDRGLYGFRVGTATGERTAVSLDTRVSSAFIRKPSEITMASAWGYLLLTAGDGEVFLADSRALDGKGYAFYRMNGIGIYHGDRFRYEYSKSLPSGCRYALSPRGGETVTAEIYEDGEYAYTDEDGVRYLVEVRGERIGGRLSPAMLFREVDGLLFFLTKAGDLGCFYTDKREKDGVIPEKYYHFDRHRYRSAVALASDDCGVAHREKQSLRRSAVVTLSRFYGALSIFERRNRDGFVLCDTLYGGGMDFASSDFANFHFANDREGIFALRTIGGGFKEKQYLLESEGYLAHFGLNRLSFRYTIGGNVKK